MKMGEYEIPRFLYILEYDFMKGNSLLTSQTLFIADRCPLKLIIFVQASLLSLLPPSLLAVGEIQKLSAKGLCYLVNWVTKTQM